MKNNTELNTKTNQELIVNFNTSYGTRNIGDFIIVESVFKEMDYLFSNHFIYNLPTHTPVLHSYQNLRMAPVPKQCSRAYLKFLDGTNIIKKSLFRPWPDWNINIFTKAPYKDVILVGAGMSGDFKDVGPYTKHIYKSILSKKYFHSVRDERTKEFLEKLGLKAINTGCATMWGLTKEHCEKIKKTKSRNVVFTITDYDKDPKNDTRMIETLSKNYEKIYFFAQGIDDLQYVKTIAPKTKYKVLRNLDQYKNVLEKGDIDYVGTRLHAGIYSLQKAIRTIIIIIDNRARNIDKSFNLPSIERAEIEKLEKIIRQEIVTDIKINEKEIKTWKEQFVK